jgi:hypothetical protein
MIEKEFAFGSDIVFMVGALFGFYHRIVVCEFVFFTATGQSRT